MILGGRSALRLGGWRWSGLLCVMGVVLFMTSFRSGDKVQVSLSDSAPFKRSLTGRALLWLTAEEPAGRAVRNSDDPGESDNEWRWWSVSLNYTGTNHSSNTNSSTNSSDCSRPLHNHIDYNDSCLYVQENCQDVATLFDYLSLTACSLGEMKWLAYLIMGLWLLLLVSLLATTADYFFVPPLNVLAEKLKLTPAVAGITLLAVGNGAPDVFTAYAAIHGADDFPLQLSALLGASIFISTVVLGAVMLVAEVSSNTIKRFDMIRDIVVYIMVVITVIGVSYDAKIYLWESVLFLVIYFLYIAFVVALSYIKRYLSLRSAKKRIVDESSPLIQDKELSVKLSVTAIGSGSVDEDDDDDEDELDPNELPGLTWPGESRIYVKIQYIVEFPFSILRWLSTPPCDNRWNSYRRFFAVIFPIPATFVLLIAGTGFDGFSIQVNFSPQHNHFNESQINFGNASSWTLGHLSNSTAVEPCHHCFPLYALLLLFGAAASVLLFIWTQRAKGMTGWLQAFMAFFAFIMSVAWLNIEANEVVSLLETLGLVMGVDTAILGLTVLAIGNSVGDLVADTTVARKKPAMGVSSCFGSPLLNDVLGLGISLTAYTATHWPHPFTFDIHGASFAKVKLSWIFLGISLLLSLIVFPVTKFSPPRAYAYVLFAVYGVFMLFSVLDEAKVLPVKL